MREIKFRGLCILTGEWLYGGLIQLENVTRICWVDERNVFCSAVINKNTLTQYTGLKGKNGREIYEGDVYSYELYKVFVSGGHVEETTEKSVDVVEFKDGAFYHGEELLADVLEWDESVKYEGNIFENPELLEVAE